jgi:hypothetical protein
MLKQGLHRATLFILLAGSIAFSCTKPATQNPAPSPNRAKVQITVGDATGNGAVQPNAKVQLYLSNSDRANHLNPATALRTGDANGVVSFDSLQEVLYYFNAYNNDMSKSNATGGNQTPKLVNDVLTKTSTGVK